jgi:exosortase
MRRNGWTRLHWLGLALMSAAGLAAAWPAWRDMWQIAMKDEESAHVFVVPLVVAGLIWVRRGRLRWCRPERQWVGPLMIAAGWGLYSLGDTYLVQSFFHAGAVLILTGCVFSVLGLDVLRKFLPALVVLVFLVPVPGLLRQEISIPLQVVTARVTQTLLVVFGLEVTRAGNLLMLNGAHIAIAEACNGMRMVFGLTLVSYAFAFGSPLKGYVRMLIVLLSPVFAILCNVIRLCPTVWIYSWASESTAETFHDVGGWVMLPLAFVMLMGIVRALRWALLPVTQYTLAYD